jgi:hypothetical protein
VSIDAPGYLSSMHGAGPYMVSIFLPFALRDLHIARGHVDDCTAIEMIYISQGIKTTGNARREHCGRKT